MTEFYSSHPLTVEHQTLPGHPPVLRGVGEFPGARDLLAVLHPVAGGQGAGAAGEVALQRDGHAGHVQHHVLAGVDPRLCKAGTALSSHPPSPWGQRPLLYTAQGSGRGRAPHGEWHCGTHRESTDRTAQRCPGSASGSAPGCTNRTL